MQNTTRKKSQSSPAITISLLALFIIASGLVSYISIIYITKRDAIDYIKAINANHPFEVQYVESGFSKTHLLRIHFRLSGVSELSRAIWYAKPFGEIIVEK